VYHAIDAQLISQMFSNVSSVVPAFQNHTLMLAYSAYKELFGGFPEDVSVQASRLGFQALILTLGGDSNNAGFYAGKLWRNKEICPIPTFFSPITSQGNAASLINLTIDYNFEIDSFIPGPVHWICLNLPWGIVCISLVVVSVTKLLIGRAKSIALGTRLLLFLGVIEGFVGGN
jgi:hypothetical protein